MKSCTSTELAIIHGEGTGLVSTARSASSNHISTTCTIRWILEEAGVSNAFSSLAEEFGLVFRRMSKGGRLLGLPRGRREAVRLGLVVKFDGIFELKWTLSVFTSLVVAAEERLTHLLQVPISIPSGLAPEIHPRSKSIFVVCTRRSNYTSVARR